MQLKLLVRDSKLQSKPAMEAVMQLTQDLLPKRCVGFITAEASGPTIEMYKKSLSTKAIDRAMISCSATSPQLSEPSFSNFLRTPPSDNVGAEMMTTLMNGVLMICLFKLLWTLDLIDREFFFFFAGKTIILSHMCVIVVTVHV